MNPAQADLPLKVEVIIFERLIEDPPRDWDDEKKMQIAYAAQQRYHSFLQAPIPAEVEGVIRLLDLTDGSQYPLVKFIQRAGPKATASVESCKDLLATLETRDISYQQVSSVLFYMAILRENQGYNLKNFVAALREHRTGRQIDWQDVVHAFDREGLRIAKTHFLAIYDALLPIANEVESFDIQLLWGGSWQYEMTQLYFLWCFLSCTPEELDVSKIPRLRTSFTPATFEGASDEIKAVAAKALKHPYVSLDATTALFSMIFKSSESYHRAQILGIPEGIINPHTAEFLIAAVAVPKPWGALQEQALKQLFDPYFTKNLAALFFQAAHAPC